MLKSISGRGTAILLLIFCLAFVTGCAQSMKQRSSMLDAMNGKLTNINYNKTYIFSTFGYPESKIISVTDGVRIEIWVYRTRMGDKETLFNMHPKKMRSMKITLVDNIVKDVSFE